MSRFKLTVDNGLHVSVHTYDEKAIRVAVRYALQDGKYDAEEIRQFMQWLNWLLPQYTESGKFEGMTKTIRYVGEEGPEITVDRID